MNTSKQINAMVVVLFLTLIAFGAYAIWDPFRSSDAEGEQLDKAETRAAHTFALNCRLCHGDRGQGGSEGGRLGAALPLDTDRLKGIEKGEFTQAKYDEMYKLVTNTIMCGRVGTFMPTWGQSQGGPLSDEQIRQLALLITHGNWDLAQEEADTIDATTTKHAEVNMPDGTFVAGATALVVTDAGPFNLGEYLRIGDERLRVWPKSLEVERGVGGTTAADHDRGAALLALDEEDAAQGHVLAENVKAADTAFAVGTLQGFAVGDTLRTGDEQVRVTAIITGIDTTRQMLAKKVGREPKRLLVSGSDGLEVGQIIRMGSELMEVRTMSDDEATAITIDQNADASSNTISVDDPTFFGANYVLHVGDEQIRVIGPVQVAHKTDSEGRTIAQSGLTVDQTFGRAQTTISISGSEGIRTGMVIRVDDEQLRVLEIVQPARLVVDRGAPNAQGDQTAAASHAAATALLKLVEENANGQPVEDPDTGQSLPAAVDAQATELPVTSITGIEAGQTYQLQNELVKVTAVQPAVLRVQRAAGGTERAEHARRAAVYDGNLLEVERGFSGSVAASHQQGDAVLMTELEVTREAGGSKLADHAKNAEIFIGNGLVVKRGALNTKAADHANGELVRDFPPPPDNPAVVQQTCGQFAPEEGTSTGGGGTAIPGAPTVAVSLAEWSVTPNPATVAGGPVNFDVTNDGTAPHNFQVISTELPPDQLPLSSSDAVDITKVDDVAGVPRIEVGSTVTVPVQQLAPGSYVLICNVPTHYGQGMHVAFTVTAP